jgi:hypothetical protein
MKRSTLNSKALAIIAAGLAISMSWYANAGPTNDNVAQVMGQNMNNTGYVFVAGQGYRDGEMLFCEPKVGHVTYDAWDGFPNLAVKDGKCVSSGIGRGRLYRALSAQQYLDELIGPGKVTPVGIAPATTPIGGLIAIIYYRALNPATPAQEEKPDGF